MEKTKEGMNDVEQLKQLTYEQLREVITEQLKDLEEERRKVYEDILNSIGQESDEEKKREKALALFLHIQLIKAQEEMPDELREQLSSFLSNFDLKRFNEWDYKKFKVGGTFILTASSLKQMEDQAPDKRMRRAISHTYSKIIEMLRNDNLTDENLALIEGDLSYISQMYKLVGAKKGLIKVHNQVKSPTTKLLGYLDKIEKGLKINMKSKEVIKSNLNALENLYKRSLSEIDVAISKLENAVLNDQEVNVNTPTLGTFMKQAQKLGRLVDITGKYIVSAGTFGNEVSRTMQIINIAGQMDAGSKKGNQTRLEILSKKMDEIINFLKTFNPEEKLNVKGKDPELTSLFSFKGKNIPAVLASIHSVEDMKRVEQYYAEQYGKIIYGTVEKAYMIDLRDVNLESGIFGTLLKPFRKWFGYDVKQRDVDIVKYETREGKEGFVLRNPLRKQERWFSIDELRKDGVFLRKKDDEVVLNTERALHLLLQNYAKAVKILRKYIRGKEFDLDKLREAVQEAQKYINKAQMYLFLLESEYGDGLYETKEMKMVRSSLTAITILATALTLGAGVAALAGGSGLRAGLAAAWQALKGGATGGIAGLMSRGGHLLFMSAIGEDLLIKGFAKAHGADVSWKDIAVDVLFLFGNPTIKALGGSTLAKIAKGGIGLGVAGSALYVGYESIKNVWEKKKEGKKVTFEDMMGAVWGIWALVGLASSLEGIKFSIRGGGKPPTSPPTKITQVETKITTTPKSAPTPKPPIVGDAAEIAKNIGGELFMMPDTQGEPKPFIYSPKKGMFYRVIESKGSIKLEPLRIHVDVLKRISPNTIANKIGGKVVDIDINGKIHHFVEKDGILYQWDIKGNTVLLKPVNVSRLQLTPQNLASAMKGSYVKVKELGEFIYSPDKNMWYKVGKDSFGKLRLEPLKHVNPLPTDKPFSIDWNAKSRLDPYKIAAEIEKQGLGKKVDVVSIEINGKQQEVIVKDGMYYRWEYDSKNNKVVLEPFKINEVRMSQDALKQSERITKDRISEDLSKKQEKPSKDVLKKKEVVDVDQDNLDVNIDTLFEKGEIEVIRNGKKVKLIRWDLLDVDTLNNKKIRGIVYIDPEGNIVEIDISNIKHYLSEDVLRAYIVEREGTKIFNKEAFKEHLDLPEEVKDRVVGIAEQIVNKNNLEPINLSDVISVEVEGGSITDIARKFLGFKGKKAKVPNLSKEAFNKLRQKMKLEPIELSNLEGEQIDFIRNLKEAGKKVSTHPRIYRSSFNGKEYVFINEDLLFDALRFNPRKGVIAAWAERGVPSTYEEFLYRLGLPKDFKGEILIIRGRRPLSSGLRKKYDVIRIRDLKAFYHKIMSVHSRGFIVKGKKVNVDKELVDRELEGMPPWMKKKTIKVLKDVSKMRKYAKYLKYVNKMEKEHLKSNKLKIDQSDLAKVKPGKGIVEVKQKGMFKRRRILAVHVDDFVSDFKRIKTKRDLENFIKKYGNVDIVVYDSKRGKTYFEIFGEKDLRDYILKLDSLKNFDKRVYVAKLQEMLPSSHAKTIAEKVQELLNEGVIKPSKTFKEIIEIEGVKEKILIPKDAFSDKMIVEYNGERYMLADKFVDMMFSYEKPKEVIDVLKAEGGLPHYLVYEEGRALKAVKIEPNNIESLIGKFVPGITNDAIIWENIESFIKPKKGLKNRLMKQFEFDANEYANYLHHKYNLPKPLAERIAAHTKVRMDAFLDVGNRMRTLLPEVEELNKAKTVLENIARNEKLVDVGNNVYLFGKKPTNARVYRVAFSVDVEGAKALKDVVRLLKKENIAFELNTNPSDGASVLRIFVDKSNIGRFKEIRNLINLRLGANAYGLGLTKNFVFSENNPKIKALLKFREIYIKSGEVEAIEYARKYLGLPLKALKELDNRNRVWLEKMRNKGFFGKQGARLIGFTERVAINLLAWYLLLDIADKSGLIPKGSPLYSLLEISTGTYAIAGYPYPKGMRWGRIFRLSPIGFVIGGGWLWLKGKIPRNPLEWFGKGGKGSGSPSALPGER